MLERGSGGASIGQMVKGDTQSNQPEEPAWRPGKKRVEGPPRGHIVVYRPGDSKSLAVASVLYNEKERDRVQAHRYRSYWSAGSIHHRKEYRRKENESLTIEPTEFVAEVSIDYRQLVRVVEFYQDGRLHHGHASALRRGGWMYMVDKHESARALSSAIVLQDRMMQMDGACPGESIHSSKSAEQIIHDLRGIAGVF